MQIIKKMHKNIHFRPQLRFLFPSQVYNNLMRKVVRRQIWLCGGFIQRKNALLECTRNKLMEYRSQSYYCLATSRPSNARNEDTQFQSNHIVCYCCWSYWLIQVQWIKMYVCEGKLIIFVMLYPIFQHFELERLWERLLIKSAW